MEHPGRSWRPPPGAALGATVYVRGTMPWLSAYLEASSLRASWAPGVAGLVGWGGRTPARFARALARARGLPYWGVEDGFLRSVGLGKDGTRPHSVVVDDLGMYFDARRPSRLEALIRLSADGAWRGLGADIRARMVAEGLTKYNHLPHRAPDIEARGSRLILLVDQVAGDQSIPAALANAASFRRMAHDAAATGAVCLVRTHPDVMAGHRRGYLLDSGLDPARFRVVADPVSAPSLIAAVDEVWTVSSQMGFDALLQGRPVRCYGAPFYAGWGLTEDSPEPAASAALDRRSGARPTIDDLVAAALWAYPVYRDPRSGAPSDVHRTMDRIVEERRMLLAR